MKFRLKIFASYLIPTVILFATLAYIFQFLDIFGKNPTEKLLVLIVFGVVAGAFIVVQFLIAGALDHAFNRPINILAQKVAKLKKDGIETYKVTTEKEKHELGELSNTIDTIILDLKAQKNKFDAQVEQKNAEISEINKKLEVQEKASINVFKELKEIDRMKTEFISLASHQLRTPLVAMKWGLQSLLGGDHGNLNEKQYEYTQDIFNSNNRMIALVNGLLNVSRIESGRIAVRPKDTNLNELVYDTIKEVKIKADKKSQKIKFNANQNIPIINTDQDLLRHVYTNLITNAIKYSPKNSDIEIEVKTQDNDQIISSVRDFGYGIPENEKKKIFTKFYRAQNVRKVETDGTGLGLYLAKSIVEVLGGTIWFESEENKGTTFWFTLPRKGIKAKEGEVSIV